MKVEISLCLVCKVGQRGQQIKRRPTQCKWVLILTNRCAPYAPQFCKIFQKYSFKYFMLEDIEIV